MTRLGCIQHLPKSPVVVLHQDYLDICDGSMPAAIILKNLEYWTDVKTDSQKQVQTENKIRAKENLKPVDSDLWIYKTYQDFVDDSLGLLKEYQVREGLKLLIDKGYILKRNNPKYSWDRTLQYKLNTELVQTALHNHNDSIRYISRMEAEQVTDGSVASNGTIPETTTETTTETHGGERQVNLALPPLSHSDLSKSWVYYQNGDGLKKSYVLKATPKRVLIIVDGENNSKYVSVESVFYQADNGQLGPVVLADQDSESSRKLTDAEYAVQQAMIEIMPRADEFSGRSKAVREYQEITEAAVKAATKYKPDDFREFAVWHETVSWADREAPTITLEILRKNFPIFLKYRQNGGNTNGHQNGQRSATSQAGGPGSVGDRWAEQNRENSQRLIDRLSA